MSECMAFPKEWEKFIEDYSFKDKEEVYTNGTVLVPVFRVEQMVEHYFGNKWIPVSDRLPKGADGKIICEVVIAYLDNGEVYPQVCVGWLNLDKWYLMVGDDDYYTIWGFEAVTHWMPLPEPPKEEKNNG